MTTLIQLGNFAIQIPEGCTDYAIFEATVKQTLIDHFGDRTNLAQYRKAWQDTRIVPMPFASNRDAAYHYRQALVALSPLAQAWIAFDEDLNGRFRTYDEDGRDQAPAIPGWNPDWISI